MNAKILNAACNGGMMGGLVGSILFIAMPMYAAIGAVLLPGVLTDAVVHFIQAADLTSSKTQFLLFIGCGVVFGAGYSSLVSAGKMRGNQH